MSHLIIDIKLINVSYCWYITDRDVGFIPILNVDLDANKAPVLHFQTD